MEEAQLTNIPSTPADLEAARATFAALTTTEPGDIAAQKNALTTLHMPEQVRKLLGMLTAYDWEFVNQAKELRSFVVGRLIEETNNPKGSVRMKALELLGKVTEVGLFTDKVEVKKIDATDEEINARIKEKIGAFLKIQDATYTDVTPINKAPDVEPE